MVTVRLNDPAGLLDANPTLPMLVGVFAPSGIYYPADLTEKDRTGRTYSFTIPYGVNIYLFVRGPNFDLADSSGRALSASGLSLPLVQGQSDLPKSFVFSLTGKKN